MHKEGDEIHETATEARDAVNVKGMTTVLGLSVALAVVAMLAVYLFW